MAPETLRERKQQRTREAIIDAAHERLVESHPELRARSLTKLRRHAETLTRVLTDRGADRETATVAAELGLACYHAARTLVDDDPERLPAAVKAAFDRLAAR
ncbi:hypothetical protein [Jiangella rhizosphaerae]|uniref:Uncharacterized protein n=1 Tax=Jiangella rhizosphaerae TaxID=2293569 RepID=A0A418KWJ3_9ACTN|nr:hypothetical protein [Jiangella rhizosphaerae]RIQ35927.1 hypothetical protein DY240_02145 [Jiangella rhizosphaerae]